MAPVRRELMEPVGKPQFFGGSRVLRGKTSWLSSARLDLVARVIQMGAFLPLSPFLRGEAG